MNREIHRAEWHDYRSRCIYMVTMNKAPGIKDFGVLAGDPRLPRGQFGAPFISTYHTGDTIKATIRNFHEIDSYSRILQYAIMPDHLHLLVFVETPDRASLGERFKPAAHNFDLCNTGRMLIISAARTFDDTPGLTACDPGQNLTRRQCLALNALAAAIGRTYRLC